MDLLSLGGSNTPQLASLVGLGLAFLGGLATAFTPCVYPMIPVTVGIMGARESRSFWHALRASLVFVLGLALVYSALGFTAATSGRLLGSLTQQPWVVWTIALLFLFMGLSLLGLFEIRLPHRLNQWLSKRGGSGYWGVLVLGMVSGCLAAPCAGPIVVGILAYVAQKANPIWGFALLFSYSLGLGTPFVLLGTFSQSLQNLPKSGVWTEWVKHLCGIALIIVFFFFIKPFVSSQVFAGSISFAFLLSAAFFHLIFPYHGNRKAPVMLAGRTLMLVACAVVLYKSPIYKAPTSLPPKESEISVVWILSEKEGMAKSGKSKKPMVIDFSADWCAACKELEQHTFTDPQVVEFIQKEFIPVRIDATDMEDDVTTILEKYGVLALPTVLFVRPGGTVMRDLSVTEFVNAEHFLTHLKKADEQTKQCLLSRTC